MTLEINPHIFGKKIGTLLYDSGKVYFEYDEAFKHSGLEISPVKLPLSGTRLYLNEEERDYFQGLPGVFHDSLPDKFGTKIIERYFESKQIPSHELNVLQKLMFVGNKSMGAISYEPSERLMERHEMQELIDIERFSQHARRIIEGETFEVVEGVLAFMDSAASAGGARAKAVVGFDPATEKMIYGLRDELPEEFEHWLIKFDMHDEKGRSQDYTKLEYLYMTMAREAGIEIPDIRLLEQGSLTHYMVRRFDRVEGERLHMHSAAGMVHANINLPGHYSYDHLMRLTRSVTGAQSDVEELYRRMVFNIIARNQDDHAKNFAFLMDSRGVWKLSPAYDITYAYGTDYTRVHQLSLKGKTTDFTLDDLLQIAKTHSIDPKSAAAWIEKIKEVLSAFPDRAKALDIHQKTIERVAGSHRLGV
jgi:serine/threonine-protein kinase HipA